MWKIDPLSFWTVLGVIGSAVLFLLTAFILHQKGVSIATGKAVEQFRLLSEALEGRVTMLESDLRREREDNAALRKLNQELTGLNLELQTTNAQNQKRINSQDSRINDLERQLRIG